MYLSLFAQNYIIISNKGVRNYGINKSNNVRFKTI